MKSRLPGLFVLGLALGSMIGTWGCAVRQAAETPTRACRTATCAVECSEGFFARCAEECTCAPVAGGGR